MLKISNLTKYYGKKLAVDNISMDINDGEIFGFVGPNGAGKTTTIKCILNLINKTGGSILMDDSEIDDQLKAKIGYVPSEVHLYNELTVMDMIKLSNSFYKEDHMKKAKKLVKKLDVDTKKKIEQLSFGNLKKVSIILAFMHDPKLVILDEPTSGLDPVIQEQFFDLLLEEKNNGVTILISSHNLSEINKICDRLAIIKDGKIVDIDTIKNMTNVNFSIVTLQSKDYKKMKLPIADMQVKSLEDDTIKFIYKNDINKLIKALSQYQIDKILIEEPSLEEIILHYYK